ncbi:hypothetical protein B0J17DRAFT_682404 [Rhizoctonia solani]|nr:hypothetical protein B0J17DRAFT_682404 [Rhizoctonia solani]
MGLPEATAEALWRPVTVLRVKYYYPELTSSLFRGLTEINLGSDDRTSAISELGLILVLTLNHKLRVFQLGIEIVDYDLSSAPVAPIRLESLERLHPHHREVQVGLLLRLIAPGPKPLTLSITNPWSSSSTEEGPPEFTSKTEVEKFFARSNVTTLVATAFSQYSRLMEVLSMAPMIRVLALVCFNCSQMEDEGEMPPATTVEELYVTCSTKFGTFAWPCIV